MVGFLHLFPPYLDHGWAKYLGAGAASGALAALFVFVPWWALGKYEYLRRAAESPFDWLRNCDIWIVKGGCRLMGAKLPRSARRFRVAMLFGAILAGVVTSSPAYCAFFVAVGLVAIIAILRVWSRDEFERHEHFLSGRKLVGADRGLRGEAAWSIILLFVIAPIGFSKLDAVYPMFTHPRSSALVETAIYLGHLIGYVWFELTHSVPVLHSLGTFYEGNLFFSGDPNFLLHAATFLLRFVYEIFVVGAIIELVNVGERILLGQDLRPAEELLASNDVNEQIEGVRRLGELAAGLRPDALERLIEIRNSKPNDAPPDEIARYAVTRIERFDFESERYLNSLRELWHTVAGKKDRDSGREQRDVRPKRARRDYPKAVIEFAEAEITRAVRLVDEQGKKLSAEMEDLQRQLDLTPPQTSNFQAF